MVMSDTPIIVDAIFRATPLLQIGQMKLLVREGEVRGYPDLGYLSGIENHEISFVIPKQRQSSGRAKLWLLAGGQEWTSPEFDMPFNKAVNS